MGPWGTALLAGLPEAQLEVEALRVEPGLVTARVAGETVSIAAPTIRPSLWQAIESYARGKPALERALRGEVQSEELARVMEHDWEEALLPELTADAPAQVALVNAFANALEEEPGLLLRWRGHGRGARGASDPWSGESVSLPTTGRRPPESAPLRFGASGVRVGDEDLVEVLVRTYRSF